MTLRDLAGRVNARLAPEAGDVEISSVASLADANPGDISFFGNPKYIGALRKTRATAVFLPESFTEEIPSHGLFVADPAAALHRSCPFLPRSPSFVNLAFIRLQSSRPKPKSARVAPSAPMWSSKQEPKSEPDPSLRRSALSDNKPRLAKTATFTHKSQSASAAVSATVSLSSVES